MVVKDNTMFPVTSVCKADIIGMYEGSKDFERIKERLRKMDRGDMKYLASKMADDYCNQLYWDSLRIIFEERFLNE